MGIWYTHLQGLQVSFQVNFFILEFEFAPDGLAHGFDGLDGQPQTPGNGLVLESVSDHIADLYLARRQGPLAGGYLLAEGRGDVLDSALNHPELVFQIIFSPALQALYIG